MGETFMAGLPGCGAKGMSVKSSMDHISEPESLPCERMRMAKRR